MPLAQRGFIGRGRCGGNSMGAVETVAITYLVVDHGPVLEGVVNDGRVNMPDSAVVAENIAGPDTSDEAGSKVTPTVIDSAVKPDMRPPVAVVPGVSAVLPSPKTRGPKQPYYRRFHPDTRNPVIITIIRVPRPITGTPHIPIPRARWLIING